MTLTIIISASVFLLLTLSIIFLPSFKIGRVKVGSYWVVALLGAILLILFKCVPLKVVASALTANSAINPIKILVLFLSMTFLSIVLDELGLFKWAAAKALKAAKEKQLSVFLSIYFLTAFLTVFTSNDIVILTLTPFICFFCKNAKINPVPYLIGEFVAANTYSMALVIGNPTNIYLATAENIGFLDYIKVMVLPTVAAGATELVIILLLFGKTLKKPIEKVFEPVKIENRAELFVAVAHLGICLIFLVISGYVKIEMWLISLTASVSLTLFLLAIKIFNKKDRTLLNSVYRLPYELIPFVLSMFVIIIALSHNGVIEKMGGLLVKGNAVFTYGLTSFIVANIINNIPMSMMYSGLIEFAAKGEVLRATYAAVIGSNIGAFLTPIGALAGIMFTNLTARYGTKLNFKTFIKYGVIISLPVLAASLFVLYLVI